MTASKKEKLIILYGFLAALLGAAAIFAAFGVYPFGSGSVLVTDMTQQYIDYFACFKNLLSGNTDGGLLYTFTTGMGMNFIGLYAYYLSSPFSFIVLLFPKSMITEAVFLMIVLKLACASAAFLVFIKKHEGKLCPHHLWFSCCYALMGFCITYFFNVMWLDAVILLPLICAGVLRLIYNDRSELLLITLFWLFFSNFYISFMAGIGVFMFFVLRLFFNGEEFDKNKKMRACIKFFISVGLAAGCAAALLLPAYKALSACYINSSGFSLTGRIAATPFELMQKMLPGVYDSVTTYGLPNIYCGTLTLALLPLYFVNKKIPKVQRYAALCIVALFALSFISYDVAVIWHVFRPPTWFNARHSFTFCFFIIYFALCALGNIEGITKNRLLAGFLFDTVIILLAAVFGKWADSAAIAVSLAMITLFYGGLLARIEGALSKDAIHFGSRVKIKMYAAKSAAVALVLLLILGECFYSGLCGLQGLDKELGFDTRARYADFTAETRDAIDSVKRYEQSTDDSGFFRTENRSMRWSNDNMSLDYNGIAHYSSLSSQRTFRTLYELGVLCVTGYRYLRYCGTTDVTDSLLGIKYVLSADTLNKNYENIAESGRYTIYKNRNALPLGYFSDSALLDYNYIQDDPLAGQNTLMTAITGNETNCFVPAADIKTEYFGFDLSQRPDGVFAVAASKIPYVEFTVTTAKSGNLYLWIDSTFNEHSPVYINENRLGSFHDDFLRGIIPLGRFDKGEQVRVKVFLYARDSVFVKGAFGYTLDDAVANKAFDALKQNGLQNVQISGGSTRISADFTAPRDGLLLTTIPYDKGWRVYLDGQKAETFSAAEAFIAVPVKAGSYKVTMRYNPEGLTAGCIISAICIVLTAVYIYTEKRRNNNE